MCGTAAIAAVPMLVLPCPAAAGAGADIEEDPGGDSAVFVNHYRGITINGNSQRSAWDITARSS